MTLHDLNPPHSPFQNLILGTDLVHVPRLSKSYVRLGERFLSRLLLPAELAYCRGEGIFREAAFLKKVAGRIALKEAVSKALGTGLNGLGWGQGIDWKDVEVISKSQSPPELLLHGRALEIAAGLGIRYWRFSLSHDGDYALATVIGLA